ncbi:uncharacterized protein B0H18DRAFT_885320, partial [Fomitopsis serialis]|uniref:uncharacterized protein n=1 Tax=Fomitopsis serialis TaxID=139415 RepID=UPI0020072914
PAAQASSTYNANAASPRRTIITAEQEAMSGTASSSYIRGPRARLFPSREQHPSSHRQLFDHRKDDLVHFSVLARSQASPNVTANRPHAHRPTPTPKSSGDYVSASSTPFRFLRTLHPPFELRSLISHHRFICPLKFV